MPDVTAGNVRTLAGAAPRLGSMKPRAVPKKVEAEPENVKDILRELLSERRARENQEDSADSTSYTAGVKGVEKLETLRRKFREKPEEKHREMMEKVHGVAPDLAIGGWRVELGIARPPFAIPRCFSAA